MPRAEARASAAAASPFRKGLASLEAVLAGPQADVCATWAGQPLTRMVAEALDDLALNPPPVTGQDEILVQYGMTLGLTLARRLVSDPASVLAPPQGQGQVSDDYDQPLDSI